MSRRGYRDPTVGDAELLRDVRGGDLGAYEELWLRHIDAALRQAQRMAPGQAEDLASEAFLAVFQQLTQRAGGPESNFRAYLYTTMRNTSIRWGRASNQETLEAEVIVSDLEDGWSVYESVSTSAQLLEAFKGLPERWQRVLWLIEVEDVPRRQVAHELGIKPNAVSALARRARQGLRNQWLINAVPEGLREDSTHVAAYIPDELAGKTVPIGQAAYRKHLRDCGLCRDLRAEISADYQRMNGKVLRAAGFAALGVSLPAASPLFLPPWERPPWVWRRLRHWSSQPSPSEACSRGRFC